MILKLPDLEKPGGGLKKVLQKLSRSLRENVEKLPDHQARRIHDIRVCAKKVRSLSRLAVPVLTKRDLRGLTVSLRELKDAFAGSRDAEVMRSRLASLRTASKTPEIARQLGLPEALPTETLSASTEPTIQLAKKLESDIAALDLEKLGREDAGKNFLKTYRRARKLMRECRKTRDDVRMHEWRKRVKDFFYQATALSSLASFARAVPRADRLSEILGEYHDFALLAAQVQRSSGVDKAFQRELTTRQRKIGEQAFKLAAALFSEKPKVWAARLAL